MSTEDSITQKQAEYIHGLLKKVHSFDPEFNIIKYCKEKSYLAPNLSNSLYSLNYLTKLNARDLISYLETLTGKSPIPTIKKETLPITPIIATHILRDLVKDILEKDVQVNFDLLAAGITERVNELVKTPWFDEQISRAIHNTIALEYSDQIQSLIREKLNAIHVTVTEK